MTTPSKHTELPELLKPEEFDFISDESNHVVAETLSAAYPALREEMIARYNSHLDLIRQRDELLKACESAKEALAFFESDGGGGSSVATKAIKAIDSAMSSTKAK